MNNVVRNVFQYRKFLEDIAKVEHPELRKLVQEYYRRERKKKPNTRRNKEKINELLIEIGIKQKELIYSSCPHDVILHNGHFHCLICGQNDIKQGSDTIFVKSDDAWGLSDKEVMEVYTNHANSYIEKTGNTNFSPLFDLSDGFFNELENKRIRKGVSKKTKEAPCQRTKEVQRSARHKYY